MAKLLPFSGKQKQVKVAVCGLSGNIDRSTVAGVGKSWLCSRLVHSEHDSFQETTLAARGVDLHSSSMSHEDFYSREVANDHFLYYGRRTVSVPTNEVKAVDVDLHVVEQTEFLDQRGENLPFHSLGAPDKSYGERATKRSLVPSCTPKHVYINRTQVRCSMRREKFVFKGKTHLGQLYPLPFKIDAYVIAYDGSLLQRAAVGPAQRSKLADLLRLLGSKGRADRTIVVVTKCDDLSKATIDAAIKDVHGLIERVQLPAQIPVVAVSAKDNVNIEFLQQMLVLCAWNRSEVVRVRTYDEAVRVQEGSLGSDLKKLEAAVLEACEKEPPTWPIFQHNHRKTPWLKHLVDFRGQDGVHAIFGEKVRPWLRVQEAQQSSSKMWSPSIPDMSEDWVEVPEDCYPMALPMRAQSDTDGGQHDVIAVGGGSGARLKRGQGKVRVNSDQPRSNGARPSAAKEPAQATRSLPASVLNQVLRLPPHRDRAANAERPLPTPPVDAHLRSPFATPSPTSPKHGIVAARASDASARTSTPPPTTVGSDNSSLTGRPTVSRQESGVGGGGGFDADVFYDDPAMMSPITSPTSAPTPPLPPTPEPMAGTATTLPGKKPKPPKPPRSAQLQDKLQAMRPGLRRASEPAALTAAAAVAAARFTADRRSASNAMTVITMDGAARPSLGNANPGLYRTAVDEADAARSRPDAEHGASPPSPPDDVVDGEASSSGVRRNGGSSLLVREDALAGTYVSRVKIAGISGSYEMVADAGLPAVETDGVPVRPTLVHVDSEEGPYAYGRFLAAANTSGQQAPPPSASVRSRRNPAAVLQLPDVHPASGLQGIPEYCELTSAPSSTADGAGPPKPAPQPRRQLATSQPAPAPPPPPPSHNAPPPPPPPTQQLSPDIVLQPSDDPQSLLSDAHLHKLYAMRGVPSDASCYLSQFSMMSVDAGAAVKKNLSLPDMFCGMEMSTDSSGYVKTGSGGQLPQDDSDADTDTDSLNYISP